MPPFSSWTVQEPVQENAICQYVTSAVPGKEKEAAFLEQAVPKLRGGLQCVLPDQLTVHKAALEFVTPEEREVRETRNLDTFFLLSVQRYRLPSIPDVCV